MTPDGPAAGAGPRDPRRLRAVSPEPTSVEDLRVARRDFIRSQHPDRGGDSVAFAEGLAAIDAALRSAHAGRPPVPAVTTGYRRPRGLEAVRVAVTQALEKRRTPPPPPRVH